VSLNSLLRDVDRWVTVALLVLFFVMVISGYMYTRGFIDRLWGIVLHNQLALPTMAVFLGHVSIQLRFALIRLRVKNRVVLAIIPLIFGVASFAFIYYLDQFFSA
jgi:hypothetical protein